MLKRKLLIVSAAVLMAAFVCSATDHNRIVWKDADTKDIPEPQERPLGYYENIFDAQFAEPFRYYTDLPRWMRAAIGKGKAADNVNALDEVPDSSWYTNRHHLLPMTTEELVRGPNQDPPDFRRIIVTKAKLEGVTPGFQVKDAKGNAFVLKFDNMRYPELQSSAEVISTKILYAAGYNVPENYIAYVNPDVIEIESGVQVTDSKSTRPLTRDDLHNMFQRAARQESGMYRVLASKMLQGKPKGPFAQVGIRSDDPNDRIPHEHRRELRALRVIASWINHWDAKEMNGLDTYVEEDGRRFLRHYLIDFGSSLGAGAVPDEYYHGRELALDGDSILKELFTLGFAVTGPEKKANVVSAAVGSFSADDFDPEAWTPSLPCVPFNNMDDEDAFWGTRIILSFSEDELRHIVQTGAYSNPQNADHVYRALLERRRVIARHWLSKVNPIANFRIEPTDRGPTLTFKDLMIAFKLADPGATVYRYQIKGQRRFAVETTKLAAIPLHEILNSSDSNPTKIEVSIWSVHSDKKSEPVRISLSRAADDPSLAIQRIVRD